MGLLALDLRCDWGGWLAFTALVEPNSTNCYRSRERYDWPSVHADVRSLEASGGALGVCDAVFHADWLVWLHSAHEHLADN